MRLRYQLALLVLLVIEGACRHAPSQALKIPVAPHPLTLPAGSTLALTTAEAIESPAAQPGQTFAAVVSRDGSDATGQLILPAGSPATLILVRTSGTLELRLASAMLNGDSFLVRNEPDVNNPAALGASLGAFLGGVPGARSFGQAGESPSAPPQVTIAGDRVSIPLGSLLTFRMNTPVQLVGSH